MPVAGFSCCSRQFSESLCIAVHPVGFGTACFVFGIHCNCFAVRPAASVLFRGCFLCGFQHDIRKDHRPLRPDRRYQQKGLHHVVSQPDRRNVYQAQFQSAAGNKRYREATEAIWETLASLMKNSIGFIIYLFLLVSLNLWLMIVILLTALTGYFVNKKLTGYGYRHREEEGEISAKIWYQIGQAKIMPRQRISGFSG